MSRNLEYKGGERQRKRESTYQASEAQQDKERQRATERDKTQRRHFILEEQHEIFVAVVRKWEMLAASKVSQKMSGSEKTSELELDDISSVKRVTGKFPEVLHCSRLLSV